MTDDDLDLKVERTTSRATVVARQNRRARRTAFLILFVSTILFLVSAGMQVVAMRMSLLTWGDAVVLGLFDLCPLGMIIGMSVVGIHRRAWWRPETDI